MAHDTGNEVTGVHLESGAIAPLVGPISRAEEVIPTRFGHSLWVASRGDGTVKRIDLGTNAITASIPVGVQPESVMLTPSERILIVSMRGTPAAVAFVDTVKQAVVKMTEIAGAGSFGDLAVMSDDGRFVYATFDMGITGTGGVAVLDTASGGISSTWTYPTTGRPHGVWISKSRLSLQ